MNNKSLKIVIICLGLSTMALAQQDTARTRTAPIPDTVKTKIAQQKTFRPVTQPLDTNELRNWERLYYGAEDESLYDTNPWDEYLGWDADRESSEMDDREDRGGQERDSRE